MRILARQFNLYFTLLAAVALFCGCQSDKSKSARAILRIHIETPADDFGTTRTISLIRDNPVTVTISKDPVLTEAAIKAARVIDTPGGFAIELQFDDTGSLMLEQYSASNVGKHFVIFGQWGKKITEGRWLAAPLISHHIGNGVLAFTPDSSREEADQLVAGLNNVAKETHATGWRSLLQ
ncbi:MAG TPA: hypothetical protein VFV81_10265 [Verrucomicrobiae bacterium]|nr:hypothetical protein [Verrucomicrobiae bacterium]